MNKALRHTLGGAVIFFLSSIGLFLTATSEARLHKKLVHMGEEATKVSVEGYILYTVLLVLGLYFIVNGLLVIDKEINKKNFPPINYN